MSSSSRDFAALDLMAFVLLENTRAVGYAVVAHPKDHEKPRFAPERPSEQHCIAPSARAKRIALLKNTQHGINISS